MLRAGTKAAATIRARKEGGEVVEVDGGWVVRLQGMADEQAAAGGDPLDGKPFEAFDRRKDAAEWVKAAVKGFSKPAKSGRKSVVDDDRNPTLAAIDAERAEYHAERDRESAAELEVEREAILAEAELTDDGMAALIDGDLA